MTIFKGEKLQGSEDKPVGSNTSGCTASLEEFDLQVKGGFQE
jgi:hypothetical protein